MDEEICNVQLKIPLCAYVKYYCQWAALHETQTNLKQTFVKNIWTEFYQTLQTVESQVHLYMRNSFTTE